MTHTISTKDVLMTDPPPPLGVIPHGLAAEPARGASGPAPGFDDLYQREWHAMTALGWSLTGSWAVAEELVQDAFADAFRRWETVSGLDRPGAWVRRAVINRSASHHRHRGVERRGLAVLGARQRSDGESDDSTGEAGADRVGDPAFWAAVRSLPERQLQCVALHYLEDRSVAEIAEVLDCRPATVKVHLHRGRLALAKRLDALEMSSSTATSNSDGSRMTNDLREEQR